MTDRERYIHTRLMELSFITDTRPLEEIEQEEERQLTEELDTIYGRDR